MKTKEIIEEMYFNQGCKAVDIASLLGITKAAVSKTLSEFGDRYILEKERRKGINKIKNREDTKRYIQDKRAYDYDLYNGVKQEHEQAVKGMSKRGKMSSLSIVINYIQSYDLNEGRKKLVFNEKRSGMRPNDVPKSVGCVNY